MIDIHYHLLFGLDDGPRTIEDSLELAEASIAEGVTHIVCTPHANYQYAFRPEANKEQLLLLNERLGGRLTLGLGCDFRLTYDNIEDALRNRAKYTINNGQYLLVEFPQFAIPPFISEHLYQFNASGIVPIITHPERNPVLVAQPNRMIAWVRGGCLIQVTAASITGRFGKRAAAMSDYLIRQNWVHFIASDAHSLSCRPPAMREAYKILRSRYGEDAANRLCIQNPRAAFFNEPLSPQPEPKGLHDEWESGLRFLRRILHY